MQVDVIPSVAEARTEDLVNRTVIVVDVLRATSVMVTALTNGADGIVPVETVQQAKLLQGPGVLLGGERFCKKISGFDLGNSPLEYTKDHTHGMRIVFTTTNGTRAIQKACKAANVLAGAFLNASAVAEAALKLRRDIVVLCAGTQDIFSLEDGLCAGLLVHRMLELSGKPVAMNDFAKAMHGAYLQAQPELEETILACANGQKMVRYGFEEDVMFCTRVDACSTVPVLKNQLLVSNAAATCVELF
jgi:2-phosphosulfolactate phosphatase